MENDRLKSQLDHQQTQHLFETKVCPKCGLNVSATISICPNDGTVLLEANGIGQRLSDQYEIMSEIAAGGMGVIYKARHQALNVPVAIKMMLLVNRLEERNVERFQQEAHALSRLDHPAIVRLRDYGLTENGQPFMVLDFVDGVSLAQTLKKEGPLNLATFLSLFVQVCDAIGYAHEAGILHRDIKPSNIMITGQPNAALHAKIVDFGIAKTLDGELDKGLTRTGEVIGSPLYMSPEQAAGAALDPRSDIYSLGCVMFEALTGSPPYSGDTAIDVVFKQLNEEAPNLVERCPKKKFPKNIEAIVSCALRKDPKERFQSMKELSDALRHTMQAGNKSNLAIPVYGADKREKRNDKIVSTTLLILLIVLPLIALILIWTSQQHPKQVAAQEDLSPLGSGDHDKEMEEEGRRSIKKQSGQRAINIKLGATDASLDAFDLESTTESVDLVDTQIKGPGLSHLIHLPLKRLYIHISDLTDRGLDEISHMSKLEQLYLDRTELSGKGLASLVRLKNLKDLSLQENRLTDEDLKSVAVLTPVEFLSLRDDLKITSVGLRYLQSMPNLLHLDLNGDHIDEETPTLFRQFKKLQWLGLEGTDVTDSGLKRLVPCPQLAYIDLFSCKNISGQGVNYLAELPALHRISLQNCNIKDSDLLFVQRCKKLERLTLNGTAVSDVGMKTIAMSNISIVDLIDTRVTKKGFATLMNSPKMNVICTKDDHSLSEEEIQALLKQCPQWDFDRESWAFYRRGSKVLEGIKQAIGQLNAFR